MFDRLWQASVHSKLKLSDAEFHALDSGISAVSKSVDDAVALTEATLDLMQMNDESAVDRLLVILAHTHLSYTWSSTAIDWTTWIALLYESRMEFVVRCRRQIAPALEQQKLSSALHAAKAAQAASAVPDELTTLTMVLSDTVVGLASPSDVSAQTGLATSRVLFSTLVEALQTPLLVWDNLVLGQVEEHLSSASWNTPDSGQVAIAKDLQRRYVNVCT